MNLYGKVLTLEQVKVFHKADMKQVMGTLKCSFRSVLNIIEQ